MTVEDVPVTAGIAHTVFSAPGEVPTAEAVRRSEARHVHALETDPQGAWVALDDGGEVCGVALAIVREDVWGLSLLAVRPDLQGRGIGRRLLERAWGYADAAGVRGRIILSSTDPKAMRRYARLGLALRPCVAAGGIVDRSRLPRPSGAVVASEDVERTAPISRHVRGAAHVVDLPVLLDAGCRLLLHGDRGFAVHDGEAVKLLAALDEEAACDLLWACLAASGPGATVSVDLLSAGQDWAVRTALDAGLALSPDGPIFTGGRLGPLAPYVPSGPFL